MADKPTKSPAPEILRAPEAAEPKIVEAAGSTHKPAGMGQAIELAMASAVNEAAAETEKIHADKALSDADKQKKITDIMSADALRTRKLAARERVKKEYAEAAAKSTTDAVDKIATDAKATLKK